MSHFKHAQNFRIDNFVNNFNTSNNSKSALERLERCITPGAIHNSDERSDAPKCMRETRVAVQSDILGWIEGKTEEENIMWLSGPAGAGKTAIAGTIAKKCARRGTLAASFFFSRFSASMDRSSKKGFVATLAYQIRQHPVMESVGSAMLAAIDKDPVVLRKRLKDQMEELILRPLRRVGVDNNGHTEGALPQVIIVDGLDECVSDRSVPEDAEKKAKIALASERHQLEVLTTILSAANDSSFPFKILVVSRPERLITEFFATSAYSNTLRLFLDNKCNPDSDIRLFLTSSFADIRRRSHIPASWPSNDHVETLVQRASGQFIYAATVIRFIQGRSGTPQSQLDSVLNLDSSDRSSQAFADLDALYTHILMSAPDPLLSSAWILLVTLYCRRPTSIGWKPFHAAFCRQFLESDPGEAEHLLGNLGSLIRTPPPEDQESPYTLFHASLLDFLQDNKRCPSQIHTDLRATTRRIHQEAFQTVLIHRRPKTPLTPEQLAEFQLNFLRLDPGYGSLISNCDVLWWTNQILTSHPGNYPIVHAYIYSAYWHYSHREDGVRRCTRKAFKIWTKSIINECRKRGWKTPSRAEIIWRDVRAFFGRNWDDDDIQAKFVPPTAGREETDGELSEGGR